jgi:ferredoxin
MQEMLFQAWSESGNKKPEAGCYKKTSGARSLKDYRIYSRREFLSNLGRGARKRFEKAMETTDESEIRTEVSLKPEIPQKRLHLLEQIPQLGQVKSAWISTDSLPFSLANINHNCNGCGMCATFCPTGALNKYRFEDQQVIYFDIQFCLACGLCRDVCPENAVRFSSDIDASMLFNGERIVLIEHRESLCQSCGQSYIASKTGALCAVCSKSKLLREALPVMLGQGYHFGSESNEDGTIPV